MDLSVAPLGGAGTYVAGFVGGLCRADLAERDRIVVLLASAWVDEHPEEVAELRRSGIEVDVLAVGAPGTWRARAGRGRVLRRAIRRHRPDAVFFPRDAVPRVRLPYVMLARNMHAWMPRSESPGIGSELRARMLRRAARRSARGATSVLAVSGTFAGALEDVPVVAVVHHGCDLDAVDRSDRTRRDDEAPQVAMIANVLENKGIGTVVEGVAKARADGQPWRLRVFGKKHDKEEAARLERLSEDLLGESVLCGPAYGDAVVEAYRQADILVVGGSFETFCFPLVEGMRSGCVVVAPACDLVSEICGGVAVTYTEGDPSSLADALTVAWSERGARSRAGLARSEAFSWESTAARTIGHVRAAAIEAGAPSPPADHPGAPPPVTVLWSNPSLYLSDCLDALRQTTTVRAVYNTRSPLPDHAQRPLARRLARHGGVPVPAAPGVLLVGGWGNPRYVAAAWRARRRGATTVLAFDTQVPVDVLTWKLRARALGLVLRRVFDVVFVPGDRQRAVAVDLGFADRDIHTGLYASRAADPVRRAHPEAGSTVLPVGRLVPAKAIDVFLDAYERYRTRCAEPWSARIVGDGPLRSLVTDRQVEGFEYLGKLPSEEVFELMADAGCFVSSSRHEPWGMVIAEAASVGLPIIATRAAGAAVHLVAEGVNGHVVPADEVDALADAMVAMSEATPEERAEMGRASILLSAQYTPATWVQAFTAAIAGVTEPLAP